MNLLSKNVSYGIIALTFCFCSCNNEDDVNLSDSVSGKLVSITSNVADLDAQDPSDYINQFEYSNQKLENWHYAIGQMGLITNIFYNDDLISEIYYGTGIENLGYQFQYDESSNLIRISGSEVNLIFDYTIEYNGNQAILNDQLGSENIIVFLTQENKISKFTYDDGVEVEFNYNNGNLRSIKRNDTNNNVVWEVTYTHDNFKNPYSNDSFKNLASVFQWISVCGNSDQFLRTKEFLILQNKNNITNVDFDGQSPNQYFIKDQSYQYTYYQNGYPATKHLVDLDSSIEYIYE
ncbi:hypothetical protein [Constantimarinum furrinae]|uniref:Uncharacterized protein n=1 Tax=Constantimarinum furrinae TaxID=2562285 RepID=A0A7G8PW43_9FLAO|nr:hypothetical protein [Constantimarinum furrinae]QNJ98559.1 hypothetical protein ALE3EI_2012 [Constantimarinum furrinae]